MSNDNHNNNNSNNNNNNDVKMGKWRALGVLNIIMGGLAITLNIVTLSTLYDWVDWIGIGIWGGCFILSAGSLTMQRSPRLISMSVLALLSGLALVIFYAYNLGIHDQTYYCSYSSYYNPYNPYESKCDWRLAADIMFVVIGVLATIINIVLTVNVRKIVVVRRAVVYPMTTMTNTTYVVTRPTTYPTQTVYQVPVNAYPAQQTGVIYQQQPGVVYQQQPGYPAVQQPVYYTQANPPAYTTTY